MKKLSLWSLLFCVFFFSNSIFAQPPYSMDEFTGINLHYWSPTSVAAVHNVREYHFWKNNQENDDPESPYRFQPDYYGVDFDSYYATLAENHEVMPCFVIALEHFYPGTDPENLSCLQNPPVEGNDDGTQPEHYFYHADYMFQYAARYGNTPVDLNLITPRLDQGQEAKTALGLLEYMENWNEPDFDNTCSDDPDAGRRFSAEQYAALLSADYDGHGGTMEYDDGNINYTVGIKNADPSMNVVLAGLTDFDYAYVDELETAFNDLRGGLSPVYPFDIINFHHYNDGNNEGFNFNGAGLAPEEDIWENRNFKQQLDDMADYVDVKFGGKELWLTEFGYCTDPFAYQAAIAEFPVDPPIETPGGIIDNVRQDLLTLILPNWFELTDLDRSRITGMIYEAQGQWLVRAILEGSASKFDKLFIFDISDDYPEPFCLDDGNGGCKRGTGLAYKSAGILEYEGEGYAPKTSYFYVTTSRNVLEGLTFDNSDQTECSTFEETDPAYITDASNTCPRIYEYSDPNGIKPNVFAFWSPTVTDKPEYEFDIALPPGTTAATIVTMVDQDEDGSYTIVSDQIQGNSITVMVTERPKFLILDEIFTCVAQSVSDLTATALSCTTVELDWMNNSSQDCEYQALKIFYEKDENILDPRNPDLGQLILHDGNYDPSNEGITISGLEANTCYWFFVVPCSVDGELSDPVGVVAATLPNEEFCWIEILDANGGTGPQVSSIVIHDDTGQDPASFFDYDTDDCIGCDYLFQRFGAEDDPDLDLPNPSWNYYDPQVPDANGGGGFDINLAEDYAIHAIHLFDHQGNGQMIISFLDAGGSLVGEQVLDTDEFYRWKNFGLEVTGVRTIRFNFTSPQAWLHKILICGSPQSTDVVDGTCISGNEVSCDYEADFTYDICDKTIIVQSTENINGDWDMGDGTTFENLAQVVHTYLFDGEYTITFTTATPCLTQCMQKVEIPQIIIPDPSFSVVHEGCNLFAHFIANEESWTHEWQWEGNGQSGVSFEVDVLFEFPSPGTYTIRHTITANGCGSDMEEYILTIEECVPNTECTSCGEPIVYTGQEIRASEIFPNSSAYPGFVQSLGQCIHIDGKLIIDGAGLVVNGSTFKMYPNAEVEVESQSQLILRNDVEFSGCDGMWKGIYLQEGARFFAEHAQDLPENRIFDALVGLSFKSQTYAKVIGVHFDRNFIGMHMQGSAENTILFNNVFECSDDLMDYSGTNYPAGFNQNQLPNVNGKSYTGLWVSTSGTLQLWSNNFRYMGNGIVSYNADDIVSQNSVIYGMTSDLYPISGNGIYSTTATSGGFLTVTANSTNKTISDCEVGIYSEGVNIDVNNIDILDVDQGISIEMSDNVDILIDNNLIRAKENCIAFNSCTDINTQIVNNNLESGGANFSDAAAAINFKISSGLVSGSEGIVSSINNNTITLLHCDGGSASNRGVNLHQSESFSFEANDIEMLDGVNGNTYSKTYGFKLNDGGFFEFSCNQIYSNSTDFGYKRYGFEVNNSIESNYYCNNMQRTKYGMSFDKICTGTVIESNHFNFHSTGILLEEDAVIGLQENKGNTWSDQLGDGAEHLSSDEIIIGSSKFEINTTQNCANSLWPCNIQLPGNLPDQIWFEYVPGANPNQCDFQNDCGVIPQLIPTEPCDHVAETIVNEELISTNHPLGIPWLGKRNLFRRYSEYPGIVDDCDPPIVAFVADIKNENIGQLDKVRSAISNAYGWNEFAATSMEGIKTEIYKLKISISSLISQMASADEKDLPLLEANKDALAILLSNNLSIYRFLSQELNSQRMDMKTSIENLNDAVTSGNFYEENESKINAIYLNSVFMKNRTLTNADKDAIMGIAELCPMEGGPDAVYKARGLADLFRLNYTLPECISGGERSEEGSEQISMDQMINILPNPANEHLVINYDFDKALFANWQIFNALGQEVQTFDTQNAKGTIDLSIVEYLEGIYYISVSKSGNTIFTEKIIIQH